jgi:hypothetical protein
MVRAGMPVAAVHEHGDVLSGKDEIRTSPLAQDRTVHEVAPTSPMQFASERQFWFGVPSPHLRHASADNRIDW